MCSVMNSGPGLKPCNVSAPSSSAVPALPGIPKATVGSNAPVSSLVAVIAATTPSGLPLPKVSGFLEVCMASV